MFFLDVPARDAGAFRDFLARAAPNGKIEDVPMMRGRIVALNGVPASKIRPPEDAAWVLEGDRGITFADTVPEGSSLTEGAWWSAEQGAKPLVSFEADLARQLGLKLGDTVTVNVLGRDLTATISNLRRVEWRNLGINFVMVFSPNTFRGAPHSDLATLTLPGGTDAAAENRILRDVAKAFPSVSAVRVKDALDADRRPRRPAGPGDPRGERAWRSWRACSCWPAPSRPVTGPGSTTPSCSRCWARAARGCSRPTPSSTPPWGSPPRCSASRPGSLAGWVIVAKVMHLDFRLDLSGALAAAAAAVALAVLLGLAGTWRILGQKPAPYLRQI